MSSFGFTLKSRNAKTGPMPVTTTSNDTCPTVCPFKGDGCYAEQGPLGGLWRALSAVEAGEVYKNGRNEIRALSWDEIIANVTALPEGTLWRHNQAGDLPGNGVKIDGDRMAELCDANAGKRGFTYTHHDMADEDNRDEVFMANEAGFTVNVSANGPRHADELMSLGLPVVTVLPAHVTENTRTPAGHKVVICPAVIRDDVSCMTCGLCQRADRKVIIGFPAHGAAAKKAGAHAA